MEIKIEKVKCHLETHNQNWGYEFYWSDAEPVLEIDPIHSIHASDSSFAIRDGLEHKVTMFFGERLTEQGIEDIRNMFNGMGGWESDMFMETIQENAEDSWFFLDFTEISDSHDYEDYYERICEIAKMSDKNEFVNAFYDLVRDAQDNLYFEVDGKNVLDAILYQDDCVFEESDFTIIYND